MAIKKGSSLKGGSKAAPEIRLRGTRIPTLDKKLAMVRTVSNRAVPASARPSEATSVLVRKAGKALAKPGISKIAVFKGHDLRKVFAYSVDPFDVTKMVREEWNGTVHTGRVVGRKFKLG